MVHSDGRIAKYQIGDPLGKILVDRHLVDAESIDAGLEKQHQLRTIKLGDYLHLKKIVTNDQLEAALKKQRAMRHLRLGDALMQESLINDQHLGEALSVQAADRKKPLGEILVEMGVVSKDTIKRVLVEKLGIPLVDLRKFQYEPNAIRAVSAEMAHKHTALPLYRTVTRIAIAMEDPMNWEALQALEFYTSLKVDPVLATREDLVFMIEQFYGAKEARENISELVAELGGGEEEVEAFTGDIVTESDNTLVRLVNKMIADAVQQEVSDIHIEVAARQQTEPGALSQGRRARALHRHPVEFPRRGRVTHQGDGQSGHFREAPPSGRQDQLPGLRLRASRIACRYHADRQMGSSTW